MSDENKTEKKPSNALRVLLFILIVLVVVLGFDALERRKGEQAPPKEAETSEKVPVLDVLLIHPEKVTVQKKYIGYVTPIHAVDVLPYINGFVEDVYVQGGQEVREGQVLLTLRQDEYKARLDMARAEVMQAQAGYQNAATYFKRVQEAGPKAIAQADRDKAQAAYLTAQAEVAQAKAGYDEAKVLYDYTVIHAPISGIVGNITLTKGQYVSPAGSPLLNLIQYSPIRVVFSITDKDYLNEVMANGPDLIKNEKIKLRLANGELYTPDGVFRFADNALNRPTNSVALYADFKNDERVLLANGYVDVLLEKDYEGVLVAQNNVDMTPDGNFITIADGTGVRRIPIEIIAPVGRDYLIRDVFKTGDYLVAGKTRPLAPGQKFRLNVLTDTKE